MAARPCRRPPRTGSSACSPPVWHSSAGASLAGYAPGSSSPGDTLIANSSPPRARIKRTTVTGYRLLRTSRSAATTDRLDRGLHREHRGAARDVDRRTRRCAPAQRTPPDDTDGFDAVMADTDRGRAWVTHGNNELLRVFPAQLVVPGDPRRSPDGRPRGAGMSWVTRPACTEIETLMGDGCRSCWASERFRSTSANRWRGDPRVASEATLASILSRRGGGSRVEQSTPTVTHPVSLHMQHHKLTPASRGACGSQGWHRSRCVWCRTTRRSDCDRKRSLRRSPPTCGRAHKVWVCSAHGTTSRWHRSDVEIADIAAREGMWLHVDGA